MWCMPDNSMSFMTFYHRTFCHPAPVSWTDWRLIHQLQKSPFSMNHMILPSWTLRRKVTTPMRKFIEQLMGWQQSACHRWCGYDVLEEFATVWERAVLLWLESGMCVKLCDGHSITMEDSCVSYVGGSDWGDIGPASSQLGWLWLSACWDQLEIVPQGQTGKHWFQVFFVCLLAHRIWCLASLLSSDVGYDDPIMVHGMLSPWHWQIYPSQITFLEYSHPNSRLQNV